MISTTQLQFRDWTTLESFINLLNLFWNRNISNDFEMRAEPLFCVMGQPSRSYYLPARATQGIVKQETVFPQISWNICDFFRFNSTRTWAKYYLPAYKEYQSSVHVFPQMSWNICNISCEYYHISKPCS